MIRDVTKPRFLAVVLLVLLVPTFSAACVHAKNPEGWASPTVSDQTALYFQKKDRLASVQLADNGSATVQWTFPDDRAHPDQKDLKLASVYEAPIVDGDVIYLAEYDGGVFALKRSDGTVVWSVARGKLTGSIVGGPVLAGDRLVMGTTDGYLYALSKQDGGPASGWTSKGVKVTGSGVWARPVVSGDTVIVAGMNGHVYGYKLADGSLAWESGYHAGGAIADLELINESTLFVPSLDGSVQLLKPSDGQAMGQAFKAGDWVWTSAAVGDGVLYFGDFAGHLYALDITTMQPRWTYDAGAQIKAAPVIVGDVLVVADRDAVVHFLDTKNNGALLSKVPLVDAGTVRADLTVDSGRALIATTKGRLYTADPKTRAVNQIAVAEAGR